MSTSSRSASRRPIRTLYYINRAPLKVGHAVTLEGALRRGITFLHANPHRGSVVHLDRYGNVLAHGDITWLRVVTYITAIS